MPIIFQIFRSLAPVDPWADAGPPQSFAEADQRSRYFSQEEHRIRREAREARRLREARRQVLETSDEETPATPTVPLDSENLRPEPSPSPSSPPAARARLDMGSPTRTGKEINEMLIK